MIERGLLPDFSEAVQAELRSITHAANSTETSVRDMRSLLWASIDNDDSLDLDQLSVAQPLRDDAVAIFVAVADVDAVVRVGSNIDGHAQANTTSVYTAAQIFPMLPERLSTDLTSLGEGVDRLSLVVEMTVTSGGDVAKSDVYRATVRNRAKLAYNSVAAWLDGGAPPPPRVQEVPGLDAQLRLQDEVAHRLRRKRFERGALSLETPEARAVFDGGTLSDLVPEGRNRAKDLIEDLMIAANGVTARFLDSHGVPSLRRILRSPERWAKIKDLAETFGENLPSEPSSTALESFLQKSRLARPSRFADLSLSVLKLLGRGEYALELPGQHIAGHFGLALCDYTHSTAPNRRFPDLVTHRLLKAAISARPAPYTTEQLRELARHCTEQEDAATKVERRVRKSAAALLLRHGIGQRFDAIVTGASAKGTYVRIDHPAAEGKVVSGSHGMEVGDRVRVELVHTDFEHGFVDFARA
jgi:VacB/RNase II family 3'-5' exoribonuclease